MVGIVQLAEHRIVVPVFVGSNPITHPITDTVNDTIVSFTVSFFYAHFYPKIGVKSQLCNAFPFPFPRDCAFPRSPDCRNATYCAFISLKYRNSLNGYLFN